MKTDMKQNYFVRCARAVSLLGVTLLPVYAEAVETLDEAWNVALKENRVIRASSESTSAEAHRLSAAKAMRMPSLTLESGYTMLDHVQGLNAELMGMQAFVPTMEKDSFSYGASANVPLFTGGRIHYGIKAQKAMLDASKNDERSTCQLIKMQVADAYVTVLRARSLLTLADSYVSSLEAHAKDVGNLFDKGYAVKSDRLAVEVALADAREKRVRAGNFLDVAESAYNRLLSRQLDLSVDIADIQPGNFNASCEAMTTTALESREELAALKAKIQALKHQTKAIRGERLPQVGVRGGYSKQENEYQKYEDQWYVYLGCQWKVFDAGNTIERERASSKLVAAMSEQLMEVTSIVSLQVRQAWLNAGEARERMGVAHSAIEQADENIKVVRDRYLNGLTSHTEYMDAETLLIDSETNYANAVYDTVIADIQLRWAVGNL